MTILDIFLIVVGLVILVFSTIKGLLRTLMMIFGFYLATLGAGFLTLSTDIIQSLMAGVAETFGAAPPKLNLSQTFVFGIVGVLLFVILYFVSKLAFEDTTLKKLGYFDNAFGLLAGGGLAILVLAVLCNTWGVVVSQQWDPPGTWQAMRTAYVTSNFRPFLHQVLRVYAQLLFQFRLTGYPPFFVPQ
ncbi:MAG: hypothetical protein GVY30_04495 [Chloroflexi bacterium]|jgi:hypothetical protein|nr:hypothetical protein [Chloroflexota bacterium]